MRKARLALPVAGLCLLVATTCGCSDAKKQEGYTLADLQHLSEHHLVVPGGTILLDGGHPGQRVLGGLNPPTAVLQVGTSDDVNTVIAYYGQELQKRGWQPVPPGGGGLADAASTTETKSVGWTKGHLVLRLAFYRKNPTDPRLPNPADQARYALIYHTDMYPF